MRETASQAVRVAGLPPNLDALLRIAAPRANPIDRLFDLGRAVDDPDFDYTIKRTAGRDPPSIIPQRDSFIAISGVRDGVRMQVLIEPRKGLADGIAAWRFRDDAAGRRARMDALRATSRGDEEVVIEEGIEPVWQTAPDLVRDAGELDQLATHTRFSFRPGPGFQVTLTMRRGDDDTAYEFTMRPFPPSAGFDYAYVAYREGAMPVLEIRRSDTERGQVALSLDPPLFGLGGRFSPMAGWLGRGLGSDQPSAGRRGRGERSRARLAAVCEQR